MSDDLRTRIITALLSEDDVALMADAVIRELGLRRAEMGEWDVLAHGFRGFRYVTPWDVDDDE